ncbi:hypothetical protein HDV01_007796 [Terramyces sp. JEL0728]|nr:hypothetical protein HDV01_007796 [Terramyces sp. JEL0728]
MLLNNPVEIKEALERALEESYKGLNADVQNDLKTAVNSYNSVVDTLTQVLFYYNKQSRKRTLTLEIERKRKLIQSKRDKYISRVSILWPQLESEDKVCYGKQSTSLALKGTHHFVDYNQSLVNILRIDSLPDSYSQDQLIAPIEKLHRLALSIRHGAFIEPGLYVPADVWSQPIRIPDFEVKEEAMQQLQKPLSKLKSIQQNDPYITNINMFKQGMQDFMAEQDNCRAFLSSGQYRNNLLLFLDQSSSILLFWLNKTAGPNRHPEYILIRSTLARVVEFYDSIILAMCLHDLEYLLTKFIKRTKKRKSLQTHMPQPKKIKTKFPAARIKRIMRLDEDVGKVSQVTPVLIAKALESFLEALVKQTLVETSQREAKKMTVAHVKTAVQKEPKFDFLLDLVKNLPDPNEESEKPKRKRRSKKEIEAEKGGEQE